MCSAFEFDVDGHGTTRTGKTQSHGPYLCRLDSKLAAHHQNKVSKPLIPNPVDLPDFLYHFLPLVVGAEGGTGSSPA